MTAVCASLHRCQLSCLARISLDPPCHLPAHHTSRGWFPTSSDSTARSPQRPSGRGPARPRNQTRVDSASGYCRPSASRAILAPGKAFAGKPGPANHMLSKGHLQAKSNNLSASRELPNPTSCRPTPPPPLPSSRHLDKPSRSALSLFSGSHSRSSVLLFTCPRLDLGPSGHPSGLSKSPWCISSCFAKVNKALPTRSATLMRPHTPSGAYRIHT